MMNGSRSKGIVGREKGFNVLRRGEALALQKGGEPGKNLTVHGVDGNSGKGAMRFEICATTAVFFLFF